MSHLPSALIPKSSSTGRREREVEWVRVGGDGVRLERGEGGEAGEGAAVIPLDKKEILEALRFIFPKKLDFRRRLEIAFSLTVQG